jgi:hypothetical protein
LKLVSAMPKLLIVDFGGALEMLLPTTQSERTEQRRSSPPSDPQCSSIAQRAWSPLGSSFAWAALCQRPLADPVEFLMRREKEEHGALF